MGLDIDYIYGQTPLEEEEKEGLLVKTISNRSELDEFEQLNIENAREWFMRRKVSINKILTIQFIIELHRRMYNDVWKWAGTYRNTNKNIGVDKYYINSELKNAIDDCKYWVESNSFEPDEIAIRLKHRVVQVHPFANGNGRHSRLLADIIISHYYSRELFTWGSKSLTKPGEARQEYLKALYLADDGDYTSLISFSRS